jgi:biopolymer transport protein TolR
MAFGSPSDDDALLGDINVTPLVDVMLVLLIIFMVTAPMLHQGIEVALPEAQADNLELAVQDPLILSINREGLVYLKDTPIHQTRLVEHLEAVLAARGDKTVFIKGDREVPYGRIIEVIDILQQGGIANVAMITEKPPSSRR